MLQKELYYGVSVITENIQGGESPMKNGIIQIRVTDERKKNWKCHAEKMGLSLTSLIAYAVTKFINDENR